MKKLVFKIIMFLLPLNAVTQNYTVLMIDKSKSMIKSSKQDKFITQLIKSKCNGTTATFEIRFINENSSSLSNSKLFKFIQPVFDISKFSKDDLELQKILYKSKVKRGKKSLAKRIISFINTYKTNAKYTNLLESLSFLGNKTNIVELFFISDGIESSKNIRMLDVYPFKSAKHAIVSAQKDVKKLRSIYELPESLPTKKVCFIMPLMMDKNVKGSRFLDTYWNRVFAEFGVENVSFKTL